MFPLPRFLAVLSLFAATACSAQRTAVAQPAAKAAAPPRPRLVVGIVVDQMRYDFLTRFAAKYGRDGFNRLLREGYRFDQMHYNYAPTSTAPGHASIYAGAPPRVHGLVGNAWYDRASGSNRYCVSDSTVAAVGGSAKNGRMSPRSHLSESVADRLKAAVPGSKVYGIAIKDRGAILPAGHTPDGAYWFDSDTGTWISSTYYGPQLPDWVTRFNARRMPDSLKALGWHTLLPIAEYTESTPDRAPGESPLNNQTAFPYTLDSYAHLLVSPHGNTLTLEFAKAAIVGANLGTDDATDLLALSLSSTDYAGHAFGPHAVELEDHYLRLDREIAAFLQFLDQRFGKDNVLVFLTADHGVAPLPEYARSQGQDAGRFDARRFMAAADSVLDARYGPDDYLLAYDNQQLYLNRDLLRAHQADPDAAAETLAAFIRTWPHVVQAVTRADILAGKSPIAAIANGFHPDRSGDVAVVYAPGWFDGYGQTGTAHGSQYEYDTHVPFLVWGNGTPSGHSAAPVVITDIAVSLAQRLGIPAPKGATGTALPVVSKRRR